MMNTVAPELLQSISTLVSEMGYELVGCEWSKSRGQPLLRIYIDSNQGITVDDCASVSHHVSAMLDVEDPIQGHYLLEVSSPGLDRPLFELAHFEKQIGQRIKLRLHTPIDNRRNWVGTLVQVVDEKVSLLVDNKEVVIPFSFIEKANVIADIHRKVSRGK